MRPTLYLSSTLLLVWPLLLSALPLPSCLVDPDPISEGGVAPCEESFPIHWAIEEGRPRREARSSEIPTDINVAPALQPRDDDVLEHVIADSEKPVRRASIEAGTEAPILAPRAVGKNEERWIIQQFEELEVASPPDESVDAGDNSKLKKR